MYILNWSVRVEISAAVCNRLQRQQSPLSIPGYGVVTPLGTSCFSFRKTIRKITTDVLSFPDAKAKGHRSLV